MDNAKKRLSYTLWVEKYRPMSLKELILSKNNRRFFKSIIRSKDIPNLLFVSNKPGTGKTSTAKCLVNDINTDHIYINMSLDNGIDMLRHRIARFATSCSILNLDSNIKKICILDEFDGSTPALQSAMRGFMEEFQDNCRFILTCNYETKIIEPLKSRCQIVDFNISDVQSVTELKPLTVTRLKTILDREKIQYTDDAITKIVDVYYPDIRKMINVLQHYSVKNNIIDVDIFNYNDIDTSLYNMILKKQLTNARRYLVEKNCAYDEMYTNMFRDFVPLVDKTKQAQVILILAEYAYRDATIRDKELNFVAALIEIIGIL